MGSYTTVNGSFKTDKKIPINVLREIAKNELEAHENLFSFNCGSTRQAIKANTSFSEFSVKDEWKGFYQSDTVKFAKDLVAALRKLGYVVTGKILCSHEYGEFWKIEIEPTMIKLLEGKRYYEQKEFHQIKEKETVIKSVEWA